MIELPCQLLGIPRQTELLIRLISADDFKGGVQIGALFLLQKKCPICTTKQSCCAGDHFKFVSGLLLACVMYQEQAHTIFVCKLLHPAHDVIIVGIAVSIGADLSDFLQGVDDNEPGIGMLPDEPLKLLIKSCTELLCIYREMQVIRSLHAEHTGHTLL